jgi:hypothetical protein
MTAFAQHAEVPSSMHSWTSDRHAIVLRLNPGTNEDEEELDEG